MLKHSQCAIIESSITYSTCSNLRLGGTKSRKKSNLYRNVLPVVRSSIVKLVQSLAALELQVEERPEELCCKWMRPLVFKLLELLSKIEAIAAVPYHNGTASNTKITKIRQRFDKLKATGVSPIIGIKGYTDAGCSSSISRHSS